MGNREEIQKIDCPVCGYEVEFELTWTRDNGFIFCGTCCKSFGVTILAEEEGVSYEKKI